MGLTCFDNSSMVCQYDKIWLGNITKLLIRKKVGVSFVKFIIISRPKIEIETFLYYSTLYFHWNQLTFFFLCLPWISLTFWFNYERCFCLNHCVTLSAQLVLHHLLFLYDPEMKSKCQGIKSSQFPWQQRYDLVSTGLYFLEKIR